MFNVVVSLFSPSSYKLIDLPVRADLDLFPMPHAIPPISVTFLALTFPKLVPSWDAF